MYKNVGEAENKKPFNNKSKTDIMISIDDSGKIIKFNEECEKLAGYSKYEVLNKNFFEILTPDRYSKQWKNVFNSIQKKKLIEDFRLPLLTHNGHEIMVSWSSFPTTNGEGNLDDISFVGRFISTWNDAKESNVGKAKNVNLSLTENEDFYKIFQQMEKKNQELEKLNMDLEKKLNKIKSKKAKKTKDETPDFKTNTFFGGFGSKKKKEDIENLMRELDERKNILDGREAQLNKEQRTIEEQRNWFVRWREKLENLEYEIENRDQELKRLDQPPKVQSKSEIDNTNEESTPIIDEMEECAAVIQRGILKQANNSFAELLGYKTDEILDKSLFDFICEEGFSGLEEYYLGRLKGNEVSVYETVFLTKDNDKIAVQVTTKPTIIDNDKAEIAVIKKLDKKQK